MTEPVIHKLFVANRGEIALRILRTCREMGITCVIGYSKADKESLPVLLADEAVCIGDSLASDSYLNAGSIIQAACLCGCDAIHPGFGFLSENAEFARMVEACGLVFVGPRWQVISQMADKTKARSLMKKAGIPVIPGSEKPLEEEEALETAHVIGYPVVIKACNGGGGKGMRIAVSEEEFHDAYQTARSEAVACFGDRRMYVEKYIGNPKHVEVQVAADPYGNCIHLFERDCSFQVRNQKLIEETPCAWIDETVREQICRTAAKAALQAGYDSIGTVEFLVDDQFRFYFMEMNTRIQVEHPITEMVTGVDLVALQIRLACREKLPYTQEEICLHGSALECRINAQDPEQNLQPSAGTVRFLNLPGGKGVRVDTAMYQGMEVYPFYDPMLCKLITFSGTRDQCIQKMKTAIEEFVADGVVTNEAFHYRALEHETFRNASYSTSFATRLLQETEAGHELV